MKVTNNLTINDVTIELSQKIIETAKEQGVDDTSILASALVGCLGGCALACDDPAQAASEYVALLVTRLKEMLKEK